ncbi:MAG: extracellular solute-binding protein [Clostridia bacterium]|nr:extracellular solute-binding protein [Clostridia bacterium]
MKAINFRFTLTAALALVLVLGGILLWALMRTSSAAAPILPDDINDTAYALKDIGILKGDGSNFNLDTVPDRVQAAIMVVRTRGEEQAALDSYAAGETENPFADVTEGWAAPYVAWVYGNDSSVSDADTEGHAPCTPAEYVTFMLRTLGYTDSGDHPDFSYDTSKAFAKEHGIYLDSFDGEEFNRGTLAKITYLTLAANVKDSDKSLLYTLSETGAIDAEDAQYLLEAFGDIENPAGRMDMKGETVTLLTDAGWHTVRDGFRDMLGNERGDTVDVALFRRTKTIEMQCGVDLQTVTVPTALWQETLAQAEAADDGAYDICIGSAADTASAAIAGLLADLSKMDTIDFSRPWWDTKINEALTLGGKQYMASGDFLSPESGAQTVLYYNAKTVRALGFDDPAAMAADGTWTRDAMLKITKEFAARGGNAKVAMLSDGYLAQYLYNAAESTFITRDEQGNLVYAADMKLLDKVYELCRDIPSVWFAESYTNIDPIENLRIGQVLFVSDSLANARHYLNAKNGLSVVVMPKEDAAQTDYASPAALREMQVLSVPASQKSKKLGTLLTLMNHYSGGLDDAFAEQYSASAEMLDLIRANTVVDFVGLSDCLDHAVNGLSAQNCDVEAVFAMYQQQIEAEISAVNASLAGRK